MQLLPGGYSWHYGYICVLISSTWVDNISNKTWHGMCEVYNIVYMGKFSQNIYKRNSSRLLWKWNYVDESSLRNNNSMSSVQ